MLRLLRSWRMNEKPPILPYNSNDLRGKKKPGRSQEEETGTQLE